MSTRKRNLVAVLAVVLAYLAPGLANAQFERDPAVLQAFQEGLQALQAEEWEAAVTAFDKALVDVNFGEAHFGRAEALRELEEYQDAIKSYTEAKQVFDALLDESKNPKLAQVYNGRGICYRESGVPGALQTALSDFINATDLDRRNPEYAANLGDIYVNNVPNGGAIQAIPFLDRAIEAGLEDAKIYRNRGWAQAQMGEFEKSISDFTKSIELDPEDYETYQRLASVHREEEDYPQQIDALTKAIEYYEPEDNRQPDTYILGYKQLANARLTLAKQEDLTPEQRQEIYAAAVSDADAILAEFPDRFPDSGDALYLRGVALRSQNLYSEAIVSLTDAIQLIPPGQDAQYIGEAHRVRGICWYHQDQISLARSNFREASSQNAEDPLPYLWTGFCHAKEGNFRKAIESYGDAAAKSPSFTLAYVNRGLAYVQLDDYIRAIENFNKAIDIEPKVPMHYYRRGLAHEKLEEWQKALDSYELALLRDADFAEANQGAARALNALGRPGLGSRYQNRVGTSAGSGSKSSAGSESRPAGSESRPTPVGSNSSMPAGSGSR